MHLAPTLSHRFLPESNLVEKQEIIEIEEGNEQRRDAMLLKAFKTPPQPRPKRPRKKATSEPSSSASGRKRGPSA
jgi:hypothetical protein